MTAGLVLGGLGVACGARTPLLPVSAEGAEDGGAVSIQDAPVADVAGEAHDAESSFDAPAIVDVEPVPCEDGQNTSYPPADCGTSTGLWFAWPYSPARDISVQRIELHTAGGNLAVLDDANSLPGGVLFQGTMPMAPSAQWIAVDLVPALQLRAGVPYWLVEQSVLCSQALGGAEFIEYHAPTLAGPWTTTGVGSYTSHIFGVCGG